MTPLDCAYLTALTGAAPWLAHRLITSSKGRESLIEKITGKLSLPAKTQPRVWFHGVSVGEIHLLRGLLPAFRQRRPDIEVIVSSTTQTGLVEARKLNPGVPVIPWPFDFSWSARNALAAIQPDLIVLMESELWPGMLLAAERAGVPVAVINGRMSPRSARHWQRAKPLAQMLFGRITAFAVQTQTHADNLFRIGVDPQRVTVTGSIKYDGVITDRNNPQTRELARLFNIRPSEIVWVAGSTQPPEEQGCLEIYQKVRAQHANVRLILVPRQKERFEDVANLLRANVLPFIRRSNIAETSAAENVFLVDTIGELRAVWGLADIAFVGGSLDGQRGGQNMIEPAAYGAAVTFGPHVWNFQATVDQLLACGGAKQVADFGQLEMAVRSFLDANERIKFGAAAQAFVLSQQGATERTLRVLDELLPCPLRVAA